MFPVVDALTPAYNISFKRDSSMGVDLYLRIDRWFKIAFIRLLKLYSHLRVVPYNILKHMTKDIDVNAAIQRNGF
jgi:hypothetical protein